MKKVIIAEKPSVAKNIAEAFNIKTRKDGYFEGNEYLVTWAFGHLLQLYDAKDYDESMKGWRMDKFPFIPHNFSYKIKADSSNKSIEDKGATKQLNIIKYLIDRNDVDGIISATDFDREGQVIADELFIYFDVKKPIYRILLNEWTENEVKKGINNLKINSEMKPLQDAGIGRQIADWIIGINLTSVATLRYGFENKQIINIGRVLLPTLKIIYDKDKEIENFKESSYFKLAQKFKNKDNLEFETLYYEESEKFEKKEYVDEIKKSIKGKYGKVILKEVEKKREYPSPLFNLSNLQGYITSKYKGWTSDKVLKVAQSLYEKKFITYPRTGSMALEESLVDRAKNVLDKIKVGLPYENEIKFSKSKRIFDNSKVESHSAITPTYVKPNNLTSDERAVYEAIKNRFLMQFMPVAEFEETKIIIKVDDEKAKGEFRAKGRVSLIEGWRKVEKIETKDTILPLVIEGEILEITDGKVTKVTKKPPKHHTEKTLLRVMETCGKNFKKNKISDKNEDEDIENEDSEDNSEEMMKAILSGFSIGTPATRAETIKKLNDIGYIKSKGKSLICTDLGKTIVEVFPAKELLDLEYTGKLEQTLADIEKGKFSKDEFLSLIFNFTKEAVEKIKNDNSLLHKFKVEIPEGKEEIGKCPICGNAVIEGEKGFGCINWKNGCRYTIWKNDKYINSFGKSVSKDMVALLLKNGKVGFRNLKSRKGNTFSAYFKYELNENTGYFNWKIEFI
ncbi:type IA DNA topoisomerase [Clostridium tarantellae]|uniref:DNA topoisomerase n=1 Tax=Clostridium tarantellae TaxID=39493 RepID=A0A6I1MUR3_9CLOT|nr:type IA DNA topoisomerase [Clostridium tarantellae]MPQ43949.1 type IA DNA topoisomerase [Clostridium tarantellae]